MPLNPLALSLWQPLSNLRRNGSIPAVDQLGTSIPEAQLPSNGERASRRPGLSFFEGMRGPVYGRRPSRGPSWSEKRFISKQIEKPCGSDVAEQQANSRPWNVKCNQRIRWRPIRCKAMTGRRNGFHLRANRVEHRPGQRGRPLLWAPSEEAQGGLARHSRGSSDFPGGRKGLCRLIGFPIPINHARLAPDQKASCGIPNRGSDLTLATTSLSCTLNITELT